MREWGRDEEKDDGEEDLQLEGNNHLGLEDLRSSGGGAWVLGLRRGDKWKRERKKGKNGIDPPLVGEISGYYKTQLK